MFFYEFRSGLCLCLYDSSSYCRKETPVSFCVQKCVAGTVRLRPAGAVPQAAAGASEEAERERAAEGGIADTCRPKN